MNLPDGDEVHLWKIDHSTVTTPFPVLYALLSTEEKSRAQRFVFDRHRHAFVINRAALKTVLARYCPDAPQPGAIVFTQNEYGKPALPDQSQLQFNISHSADKALVAVSGHEPVGVDCEKVDEDKTCLPIAMSQFSSAEYEHLVRLPPDERAGVFFQYWARREATMKASGMGFSLNIRAFRYDQDEAFINNGCELVIPELGNTAIVIKDCQSFSGFRASVARVRRLGAVTCFSLNF